MGQELGLTYQVLMDAMFNVSVEEQRVEYDVVCVAEELADIVVVNSAAADVVVVHVAHDDF